MVNSYYPKVLFFQENYMIFAMYLEVFSSADYVHPHELIVKPTL